MNTPVKFELSKLLKEKEFDLFINRYYEHALTSKKDSETNDYTGSFGWKKGETNLQSAYFKNNYGMSDFSNENWYMCSAPTIAEVVMWLYEKHSIWISVQPNEPYVDNDWCFAIFKDLRENIVLEGYDSPTESYEAAIKYVLNKYL